ncbi:hypothetical protein I601_3203 [Nocardioides dokdonensis FR1436]|uniref:DUF1440 domain-containing protein n=1 Tax=Nocardioides dokdonensis FR1436 TaxID=1300347 RepID=A0A1A9GPM1_9ACTN|nr:hypothetical protein [Nocardioides dokdonensis]ANH39610.1 hypothetical protein I601_3203 [Nocardioides dokdonensis FR1436]
MTTLHPTTTHQGSLDLPRTITAGAIGGGVAGMMMAMIEMAYGAFADGHTLWDAPMAIWAFVAGSDQFGAPSEHVGAIVLGMGGHLANSMMLGVAFALLMAVVVKKQGVLASVALGTMFGIATWVVMRYVVLPLNAGTADLFTGAAVSPQWLWYVAHAAFGMTLGLIYARHHAADSARPTA